LLNKKTIFAAGVLFMLSLTYMAVFVSAWNPLDEGYEITFVEPDNTKAIHYVEPDNSKGLHRGIGTPSGDGLDWGGSGLNVVLDTLC
jgi:hypothetical protein